MANDSQAESDKRSRAIAIPIRTVGSVIVAVSTFALVASSEPGPSVSVLDDAVNDLNYLHRPVDWIEKLDRDYGWALAIEREEIELVRVHFVMSKWEHQTLAGIGRPAVIEKSVGRAPLELIAGLQDVIAETRLAAGADATSMPVVRVALDDGSVVFASPRVLMRHCPTVTAPADVFSVSEVYVVLEDC